MSNPINVQDVKIKQLNLVGPEKGLWVLDAVNTAALFLCLGSFLGLGFLCFLRLGFLGLGGFLD